MLNINTKSYLAGNARFTQIGVFIGSVNILLLYPIVLEPGQFGLVLVMFALAHAGAQVSGMGVDKVTQRFFPFFRDPARKHHGYLFLAIAIPFSGFLIVCLAGWLLRVPVVGFYTDRNLIFGEYYSLMVLLLFFVLYFNILKSCLNVISNAGLPDFLQNIILPLSQSAILLAYYFERIPFGIFMQSFVLIFGIQTLILFSYTGFIRQFSILPDFSILSYKRLRSMAGFASYAMAGNVAALAPAYAVILLTGGLASLEDAAVLSVGYFLASLITVPAGSFFERTKSRFIHALYQKNASNISALLKKSSAEYLMAGGIIFICIGVSLDYLYQFLPDHYQEASNVFLFAGLAMMINLFSGLSSSIILTSKWHRFDLYASGFLLLASTLATLLLVPRFGITGAAIAIAISILLYNAIYQIYTAFRFGMHPFSLGTLLILILLILAFIITWMIPPIPFWYIDMAVRLLAAVGIILIGNSLYKGYKPDE